ncbi:MAG: YdcF family protein [Sarcina sp.]
MGKIKSKGLIILGFSFVAYYVFLLIILGFSYLTLPFIGVGATFLMLSYYDNKYEKVRSTRFYENWRKKLLVLISIVMGVVIAMNLTMLVFAMNKNENKVDCVMVLGAGLEGDQVSKTLKSRLDGAVDYIKEVEDYGFIILSGGQGHDELISEAEAMRRYLVNKGVPDEKIVLEDKSTSTFENFKYSKSIIEEKMKKSIDEVSVKTFTNGFHCMRSYFLGKRLGYGDLTMNGTKTPYYLAPYYYFREIFAIGKSIVFDK